MPWCEKERTVYEERIVGGSGGPTPAPETAHQYGRKILVPVKQKYWTWCPEEINTGYIVYPEDRNGFGDKPGSNLPDKDYSDVTCNEQANSIRFTSTNPCSEDQKKKVRDAIYAICKDNWKLKQRLKGLIGCSDAIDALIQCMTSYPWKGIYFDCDSVPYEGAFAITDPTYNSIWTCPKLVYSEFGCIWSQSDTQWENRHTMNSTGDMQSHW